MQLRMIYATVVLAMALTISACGGRDEDEPTPRPDAAADTGRDTPAETAPDTTIPDSTVDTADTTPQGFTIHDIQDTSSAEYPGRDVEVTFSGIVTAIDTTGSSAGCFWVQDPAGGPYSGVYIYNEGGSAVNVTELQVGHLVEITGTVIEYYDLTEVQVSSMTVSNALPAPLTPATVNPADVATGGALAEAYEGVLVQVTNAVVTSVEDFGVFGVTGGLKVDDALYYYTNTMSLTVGYEFDRIAGVMDYTYEEAKLYPRDAADMEGEIIVPPELTIYDIQDTTSEDYPGDNTTVTVSGVVTAIDTLQYSTNPTTKNHFWIQDPTGGPYSGILVYNQYSGGTYAVDITGLEVGDTVEVTGLYKEYYNLSEINVTSFTITDTSTSAPAPVVVTPADVATGGTNAEAHEGMLVTVQSVSVTTPDDDTALRQYGKVAVTGGLEIDDELYAITPLPTMGTAYTSLTGVLTFTYDAVQLYPRSAADVVAQ